MIAPHSDYFKTQKISHIPFWTKLKLRFIKPIIISEQVTKETTNFYEFKVLGGKLYLIDSYGVTTFGPIEFVWPQGNPSNRGGGR